MKIIAVALRKAGVDAISTPASGRIGESDESQLSWAAAEARALVTFNVADFVALHAAWMRQGCHHSGVIVSSQLPIGELLRRLLQLAGTLDRELLQDRLEYLSDW